MSDDEEREVYNWSMSVEFQLIDGVLFVNLDKLVAELRDSVDSDPALRNWLDALRVAGRIAAEI